MAPRERDYQPTSLRSSERARTGNDPHAVNHNRYATLPLLGSNECLRQDRHAGIFLSGVFGAIGTESENLQVAVMVMRNQLTSWYKHKHELDPGQKINRLSKLSTKSVGTRNNRCFKGKAAETCGVILFFIYEIRRLGERVQDGQRLLRAGQCLERIVLLWRNCDWEIPRDAQEERYTFRD